MSKNVSVSLDLDITGLRKQLDIAISYLKKISGESPKVEVDVDTSEVDAAEKKVDGLSGTENVTVNVDTKGADKAVGGLGSKLGGLGSLAAGAAGGLAAGALSSLTHGIMEGAQAADDFGDKLEVAFQQQGVADIDAEIEKVNKSTLELANDLGLPAARTRELAGTVATLGGITGKSAEDLTKLSAGLEVFTDGAVKGEAVAKAFSKGVADPEGAAAIDALAKKYPQLAEVLKSNLSPTEKLQKANEMLGKSFETVKEQQNDAGGILNKLQNQLGELFEKVGSQVLDAIAPLAQSLLPILEQSIGFIGQILEPLQPVLEQLIGAVVKIVTTLSGPIMTLLMAALEPVIGLIGQLLPVIMQVIDQAMGPLAAIIGIVADAVKQLFPAFEPVLSIIISLLPVVGDLIGSLLNALVPVIRTVAGVVVTLVKAFFSNEIVIGTLINIVRVLSGVLQFLTTVLNGIAYVANIVGAVIEVVVEKISTLVNAIATFDLGKIKDAILGFGDVGSDVAKKLSKGSAEVKTATAETGKLAEEQKNVNAELKAMPTGKVKKEGDDAKKTAEELKKAKEALADLSNEQRKRQELSRAESLSTVEERELEKLRIESEYAKKALEEEKKSLKSTGELRETEEKIIAKKIEMIAEETQNKKRAIQGKAAAERIKQEQEVEKAIEDVSVKAAEERVKKLQEKLAEGETEVASDLIAAQRALVERSLSSQIDAIIESSPKYKTAAAELSRQLQEGLLNEQQFKDAAAKLRQDILVELQSLPSETTDPYAQRIRAAYEQSTDAILDSTRSILSQVAELTKKNKLPTFAESLITLGDVVKEVNFDEIFGQTSEKIAEINEEQQALIESVKSGESSYQDAIDRLGELQSEIETTNSATLEALAATSAAFAASQLEAFATASTAAQEYLNKNIEIQQQLVELEKLKNQELAKVREDDLVARTKIEERFAEAKKKLEDETTENTEKANEMMSLSYANLAASAAASFTSMVLSGEGALKALVIAALDALNALVPVLVAQITGVQLASPNPLNGLTGGAWALAGAAALTAVLYGLVAAAKSAVAKGFKSGGYTGDLGVNDVAGVVHGGEYVINARATKRNRSLLEHINSGRSIDSFPALSRMLSENNITTIPMTEVQMMRAELTAIRKRLDGMPDGIRSAVGVDLNVGMDTYLYERDRHRRSVRSLRG